MSQYINNPGNAGNAGPPHLHGGAVRGPAKSGMAVASMILGILSLLLFLCFGWLLSLVGLVLGIVAVVSINKSGGTQSGKGMAMTGIILSSLGLLLSGGLFVWALTAEPDNSPPTAEELREVPLRNAESNISISSGDRVGFGNTEKAAELATNFATSIKALRNDFFTGADAAGISLTGGEFLTHCEIHDSTVAFLVHVPGLRKFDDEGKDSLCELAWIVAQNTLADSGFPEGGKVAVGVKGMLLYEQIVVGEYHSDVEKSEASIVYRGSNDEILLPFFPIQEPSVDPESIPADSADADPALETPPAPEVPDSLPE